MKKKQGFTLVELLAVIVVLAIIALIAVPTILGVIEKARRSSLQDSGYGLVEAADLYYAQYQNGKTVRFDIEDNQIITEEENKLNYKGTVKNGTVLINQKGQVTVCINDGNHAAYKNYQDTRVTVVDKKTCMIPESSYIVYLDGQKTITELTNQELTNEIENLKQLIETQNEKIEILESEKSNQSDVTNSITNLTTTHNSDVNNINNKTINLESKINNIQNNLNASNFMTLNPTSYQKNGYIAYWKSGNVKSIMINGQFTLAGEYRMVGTLPEGYRPPYEILKTVIFNGEGYFGYLDISPSGAISLYLASTTEMTINVYLHEIYI